jgi:transposase
MVRLIIGPWRTRQETTRPGRAPAQLAHLILQPAGRLTEGERETLADVLHANPLLARGCQLKTRFQALLAERKLEALEPWLQPAATSAPPSFQAVARSCRHDIDAVRAALTTPWSTGPCEGHTAG